MSPEKSIFPVCVAALLGFTTPALADAERAILPDGAKVSSASGAAQATIEKNGSCFTVTVKGEKQYTSTPSDGRFRSGELYLSNDGKTAVWILSPHFYGHLWSYDKATGYSVAEHVLNDPALVFYRQGKSIKTYSLRDLLVRPRLVSMSVSHTQWLSDRRKPDSSSLPAVMFAPDGSKLEFETTSFRHYVFDPTTGNTTVAGDSDIYQKADLIVNGELVENGNKWAVKTPKLIKGKTSDLTGLVFDDPTASYSKGHGTVALKKVSGKWQTTVSHPELSNVYNVLE